MAAGRASRPTLVPAALMGSARPTDLAERVSSDRAVDTLLAAVGGRHKFVEALEIGARQAEVDHVLTLLADPRYERMSLRWICDQAGISVMDLFAAFRSATLLKAQIAATEAIAAGIVPVVQDVLARAVPYDDICQICEGIGQITPNPTKKQPNPAPQDCRACRATGRVRVLPDLERQKLAIDLADLVKKGGGISLTQQTAVTMTAAGGATGTLERMQQAMGKVLASTPLVLEHDPVELEPAGDAIDAIDTPPAPHASQPPDQPPSA